MHLKQEISSVLEGNLSEKYLLQVIHDIPSRHYLGSQEECIFFGPKCWAMKNLFFYFCDF